MHRGLPHQPGHDAQLWREHGRREPVQATRIIIETPQGQTAARVAALLCVGLSCAILLVPACVKQQPASPFFLVLAAAGCLYPGLKFMQMGTECKTKRIEKLREHRKM